MRSANHINPGDMLKSWWPHVSQWKTALVVSVVTVDVECAKVPRPFFGKKTEHLKETCVTVLTDDGRLTSHGQMWIKGHCARFGGPKQ